MSDFYAPNQQVVRADGSGPAEEGTGGSAPDPEPTEAERLDAMTKDELLDEAEERGLDAYPAMNKAEIRAVIEAG